MSKLTANKRLNLSTIVSLVLALSIISLYLILILQSQNITKYFKEKINFTVEFEPFVSNKKIKEVQYFLEGNEGVKPNSVKLISKENALDIFQAEEAIPSFSKDENPFNDVLLFNVLSEEYTDDNILYLKENIEKMAGVAHFYDQHISFENIKSTLTKAQYILLLLASIFILMAFIILQNSIRNLLLAYKFEIKTMEFVGAKRSFIKRPFLSSINRMFITSWVVTLILLGIISIVIFVYNQPLFNFFTAQNVALGLIISGVFSFLSIKFSANRQLNRYLSKKLYELYD